MRFLAMTNHYVFAPEFCNPAAGWEKGQVEKNVQDARPRLWQQMPDFPNLMALNDWLEQHCQELWRYTAHGTLPGSIADVWADERAALMALPTAFDGFVPEQARLTNMPDYLRAEPLQRACIICKPARQPADISRAPGRCGRGKHSM